MPEPNTPLVGESSAPPERLEGNAAGWQERPVAAAWHTALIILIVGTWSYLSVIRAGQMRAATAPNRLALYLNTLIFEWVLVAVIYAGVRLRGRSMSEVLGTPWRKAIDFWRDVGIALIFWVVAGCILMLAGLALRIPRQIQNGIIYMLPRGATEIIVWVLLSVTAGICEEIIFRGYLQRQFTAWTRSAVLGIVLAAAFFGAGHSYQGGRQPILIGIFGLLFGILAQMRRSIKPGMLAHALQDGVTGIIVSVAYKLH
ncbi:MAG TPA: type II CAAX endopeptidase family protein [Candidatus Acidoferrales bacterium]|nr:type II CAAX endopeptidase family protein [Candidatus Acidoferrales bacterium]